MYLYLIFIFFILYPSIQSKPVTISNIVPRFDINNNYVNAHDGCLIQYNNMFYQYGTVYEHCIQEGAVCDGKCGYLGNVFSVYSSPDLETWTLLNNNVLPELSKDNNHISYWEANVGYHTATNTFFMYYWSGHYGFVNNSIAVAISTTGPQGPFVNIPPINVSGSTVISDTIALFVDDDGTAYLRYNTIDLPRRHIIEKLDSSWRNSTGEYSIIFEKPDFPWYDGGGMLKRNNLYYIMLSFDCCFCSWGSDALVFIAPTPLGPWLPQANITSSMVKPISIATEPINMLSSSSSLVNDNSISSVLSTTTCNLTGSWSGVFPGDSIAPPNLQIQHYSNNNTIQLSGAADSLGLYIPTNNTIIFPSFPGYGDLQGIVSPYNSSIIDICSNILWENYTPNGTFWCKYPICTPPVVPPANWTNEVNYCSTGLQPPRSVENMYINPCSQNDVYGPNFTIPAQQFNIATLTNSSGYTYYLYYGEHFRSAIDNYKDHDLQSWIPLQFMDYTEYNLSLMLPMVWMDEFVLEL